jgi:hypothetical protein
MEINLDKLTKELTHHQNEHERVLYKYLVLHLLRDYFTTSVLEEVVKEAQDFLKERK